MNSQHDEQLDRWLNKALGQYSDAQPRVGLAARILTNLAIERQKIAVRWRWRLAVASMVVICGVLALRVGIFSHVQHSISGTVAARRPMQDESNATQIAPLMQAHARGKVQVRRIPSLSGRARKIRTVEQANEPRLEQFPSPRPLSEEEKLLKEFVRNSPQEAVLVAEAQAERQKELDRLMADQPSKSELDQLGR
jgi:hypothetical protein